MILRSWLRDYAISRMLFFIYVCLLLDLLAALPCLEDCDEAIHRRSRFALDVPAQQVIQKTHSQKSPPPNANDDILSEVESHDKSTYRALLDALEVMEARFFEVSHGTWPEAIDWTAAVMGTQVSATLAAMTEYEALLPKGSLPPSTAEAREHENQINRYFTQITSFYFGENAFSLRTQAYDDMLWVVLGWLEAIKFIERHSELHYTSAYPSSDSLEQHFHSNHSWYARQFVPQYAHRARLFYDLASRGWDTTLCGGGMIWNPYLAPYKNAITNELFIAASVSMYLYFPGDSNPSPFLRGVGNEEEEALPPAKAHDIQYLDNAIKAYEWLKGSGMRNEQGLYADGFHIKGWRGGKVGSNGTGKCDLREEKVYTYNQGVLLSGLRGLWEATGSLEYLQDGHELVRNVIAASGWGDRDTARKWRWAGLGRNGVLEELCDWSGTCSQNGQTFKGIFFHHLTLFCTPLLGSREGSETRSELDDDGARHLHQKSCDGYGDWIRHNAFAAYVTRDENGVYGEWWGRPSPRWHDDPPVDTPANVEAPTNQGTDYRNIGVPRDEIWRLPEDDIMYRPDEYAGQEDLRKRWIDIFAKEGAEKQDINDRGRGRTVETQSGGVAVLRALWRLVDSRRER